MTLTKDQVESAAPDQASLGAALKLLKPGIWPTLAREADTSLLWGECQGSGATPYRVIVSTDDLGTKCTCPSRKFPCKHALALMWAYCEKPDRFEAAASPDWVREWLSRRRPKGTAAPPSDKPKTAASMAAALDEAQTVDAQAGEATDPKAAARAAAQRLRVKEAREASVLAGLDELDRWIVDQLQLGLAGFAQRAAKSVKTLSTRLVDAKAQGLAGRIDALAVDVFRVPEQRRGDLAFEQLAALSLISSAYRQQDRLPAPVRADVRRVASWTMRREELLVDPDALRLAGVWMVAATRSEVQPDKLRRLETWLLRATPIEGEPKAALLVDFVPVSSGGATSPFAAGETLSGELVFYPSATPLRALLASRSSAPPAIEWPVSPAGLDTALRAYEAALARQPWLERWPLAASGLHIERLTDGELALADQAGLALPLDRGQTEALLPLMGLGALSALFLWDGQTASLLAADTPIGRWHDDA